MELLLQQVAPGSSPRQIFSQLAGFAVDLDEDQTGRLRLRREVGNLELDQAMRLDPPMRPDAEDNDVFLPQVLVGYTNAIGASLETVPWGVRAIWQGRDISSAGNAGAGSYAFVIDSGVLATTNDLNLNTAWSRSWIAGQDAFTDGAGHGTHVAGTIGALVNGRGVVGVAPGASIVSLKVFDSTGRGSSANIIAAIDHAVSVITTNNLDLAKVVINLSLGGGLSAALNKAMLDAANAGIRLVVAAGNGNARGIGVDADTVSPATTGTHPNIYTVSAVDNSYRMATWSNWDLVTSTDPNDSVDLAAPGVAVTSYYQNGILTNLSGTSMAAPHVAGALLMGGVQAGDLVTPSRAGTADPFAWATSFPGVTYNLSAPAAVDEGLTASRGVTNNLNDTSRAPSAPTRARKSTGRIRTQASGTLAADLGRGQIDTITGGVDTDLFLLADRRDTFYNDGNSKNQGSGDYALIKDFKTGESDRLQLRSGSQFLYSNVTINGIANTETFLGNSDNRFNAADELIARLENTSLAPGTGVYVVGNQLWTTYV